MGPNSIWFGTNYSAELQIFERTPLKSKMFRTDVAMPCFYLSVAGGELVGKVLAVDLWFGKGLD